MNIVKATASYEQWLGGQIPLLQKQLAFKHQQMETSLFAFLRATFYRWAQGWEEHTGEDDSQTPRVLGVGDLHIENFGTWRDIDGRLVWGVNDFDEAHEVPYACDLVRLATSAVIGAGSDATLSRRSVCDSILWGYRDALRAGGRPFVLGEKHSWLTAVANSELRNPLSFWRKLRESAAPDEPLPVDAKRAIESLLPAPEMPYHVVTQTKGLGSLGHRRYIALADFHGGNVARETKQLAPSACAWAAGEAVVSDLIGEDYSTLLASAVRCPDPMVRIDAGWLVRRLAPDCSRIELESLTRGVETARLLRAMGWETANVHLATREAAREIRADLKRRPGNWLSRAVRKSVAWLEEDWRKWREREKPPAAS